MTKHVRTLCPVQYYLLQEICCVLNPINNNDDYCCIAVYSIIVYVIT